MKSNPHRLRKVPLAAPSLAALACCLSITPLQAQLVIHEPFAQAAGTLSGKAGGTGLSGNWTVGGGTVNVVTPSTMVFGGLAMSNGHANLLRTGNTNARVTTASDLATAGLLADNAELWFSLVIMKTAGGGPNEWSGFAFGTDHLTSGPGTLTLQGGNGLGFQTRDANVTIGTWNGSTTPATGGSLSLTYNVPTLIVGKIKWGATAGDVETITLHKPSADLSDLTTLVTKTMAAVDQSLFDTISYSLRDVDTMNYDEIRFGATQADVMPVDTVAPTLLSITDDKAGGPIGEDVEAVTYTLTFDKHMDLSTITDADFDNAGTATATVGTVTQVSQTQIAVQLLPTTTGTLQLRIPLGSELKSFANLALDTDPELLDDTTITINAGTTAPSTPSSNRWWDGTTITGITNGASAGGTATWDDGTTTNWDRGAGFEAPVAWNNANGNTAIFGGTAGTVTLGSDISLDSLIVTLPTASGSGYSIGNVGEDNTLTFTGTKIVTTTATGTGTNQDIIVQSGISGSPTFNISGRNTNAVNNFSLLPGAGVTQTIGTLNMLNTLASNKRLILGGASSGNVVDTVTWSVTNNQLMLTKAGAGSWTINNNLAFSSGGTRAARLYVEQGTLTLGGTSNFLSHKIGVATVRETVFTASNTAAKLVAKGTITIGDNREWFYVQNAGTISPGPGVATLNVTWNANSTSSAANGAFNMQTGSTYEWDIASSTSTDVINVTTGGSNNGNLILGNMTIKINDAGVATPIVSSDQLTVFTYETGAQAVLRSIGTVTIDTTSLGAGWSGTPTLVDDNAGTIYVTGLSYTTGGDMTPPTVTTIVDDKTGGPVTVNTMVTYTVSFSEDIATTLTASHFDNEGTAAVTIGTISETSPTSGVFTVQVTPSSAGSLKLRIKSDALIEDTSSNDLVVPVSDDTTITVQTQYQAWAGGAAFGNDANGDGISNGLAFLLGAANPGANALALLPKAEEVDGDLVLTFSIRNLANRGAPTLNVEHSSDLGLTDAWEAALVPDTSSTVNDVVFVITADGILNDVVATIPESKAAAGKLFGRVDSNE